MSLAAASKALRAVTKLVDDGAYQAPSQVTVESYLTRWLASREHAKSTLRQYRRNARIHVIPHIGNVPLSGVTALMLNDLYSTLRRKGSPDGQGPLSLATVRHVHHLLSAAYKTAVREGVVAISPTKLADPPSPRQVKHGRKELRAWTASQLGAFLASVAEDHYYALWFLLASTGLRRGEALGLRWSDLNEQSRSLSIRRSIQIDGVPDGEVGAEPRPRELIEAKVKYDKPRSVSLDPHTLAVLQEHRVLQDAERKLLIDRWDDQDLIFCRGRRWLHKTSRPGTPLNPERISDAFRRDVKRSGLPAIRLHDLRHTWATLALQAGVPLKVVSERLGHQSISITADIYQHVTMPMDADAAATVATLFVSQIKAVGGQATGPPPTNGSDTADPA